MASVGSAPTWSIHKNLLLLAGMQAEEAYHWVKEYYFKLAGLIVAWSLGLVALGTVFNALGWYPANLILAAMCIVNGAVLAFQPAVLASVYVAGKELKGSGNAALNFYVKVIADILLFAGLVFMFLASVRIEQYGAVLFLFVALATSGLLSIAKKLPPNIYYTVVSLMVMVFVVLSAFNMLVYQHPQDTVVAQSARSMLVNYDAAQNAEMERLTAIITNGGVLTPEQRIRRNQIEQERDARSGHRGLVSSVLDSGTVFVSLWDAKPQVIGSFPPGYVNIKVNPRQVTIDGVNYWIDDYVRINGKNPKDGPILIDADHKAVMTIAFNVAGVKNTKFDYEQRLAIEYTKAPL